MLYTPDPLVFIKPADENSLSVNISPSAVTVLKDITSMSLVFGGAVLKVRVVPFKEYVSLCWYTPSIYTCVLFSLSILFAKVKAVVLPLPEKPS